MRFLTFLIFLLLMPAAAAAQQETSATLKGRWEGVIEDRVRPIVTAIDFDSKNLRLDATGTADWKLENLSAEGNKTTFEFNLRGQLFSFDGNLTGTRIRGTLKTNSKTLAFSLDRLPDLQVPRNRVEAWQQDVDDVLNRFLKYDRSYSPEARVEFRKKIASLRSSLAAKSDQEIQVELARIIALGGNAHTRLYLIRNRTEVRRVPIRLWWFRDELRIVRAAREHTDLLGCRVTGIGGMNIAEAARRVRGIKAGNDSWQRYMSTYLLSSPDILFGAHITNTAESVSYKINCGGNAKTVKLTPLPLRRSNSGPEAWWALTAENREPDTELVPFIKPENVPLYLRNTLKNYWFEYQPDSGVLYFQFYRSEPMPDTPVRDFSDRLFAEAAAKKPRALIIDCRFNTGGDLTVSTPLMRAIADRMKDTPIYVITGRATFSAGISHVVQLKQWAKATIVGEPVGDHLDFWSEGGNLLLPNSKLTTHYGNAFHSYSKKEYPQNRPYQLDLAVDSVAPDIPIEISWQDYISGSDPAIAAILKRTGSR